jgi:putative DNA primase/helicase
MFDIKRTEGRWPVILSSLGIEVREDKRHDTCPFCNSKNFRFDDKDGTGEWICTCGSGNGWDILQCHPATKIEATSFVNAVKIVEKLYEVSDIKYRRPREYEEKALITTDDLRAMFSGGHRITDKRNLASEYLHGRGITVIPPTSDDNFQPLWYHPGIWHHEVKTNLPAMLAIFQMPDGKAAMIQKHYIDPETKGKISIEIGKEDNGKPIYAHPKLSSRACVAATTGGAVRLFPLSSSCKMMYIAEGVETALAMYQWAAIKWPAVGSDPIWAALTANRLAGWICPSHVENVGIVADNDRKGAGLEAAAKLQRRLRMQGKSTTIFYPTSSGCDWVDVLTGTSGWQMIGW